MLYSAFCFENEGFSLPAALNVGNVGQNLCEQRRVRTLTGVGVFLAISRVISADDIDVLLLRAVVVQNGSVEDVHHTVAGMLPPKQPIVAYSCIDCR